jgi:beta-lactamase superfamily II metal-dependent hydrolase
MINVHFVNVGQGNMIITIFPDNKIMFYDCNITEENKYLVFNYLKKIMPKNEIDVFVNSHRDADHIRGIKKLHDIYPISTLWDSGVSGNTEAPEYNEYMNLRRNITFYEVGPRQHWKDKPNVKILSGKRDDVRDINAQSIVIHINNNNASVLLTGDTDAKVWMDYIIPEVGIGVKSSILLASHHGAITFFDDTKDAKNYYTDHIKKISPAMTIISVGDNSHGHPDEKALELYSIYSSGSNRENKIARTDIDGNIKVLLKDNGSWELLKNQ